ncbi:MAG: TIGR04552 family protein [Myxococcales bacterium]|nr:TIGR04552 family protein [Myxococcales bacterium]
MARERLSRGGPPRRSSAPPRLRESSDFLLHDLEAVRLVLQGESVIDWHRLNFTSEDDARRLIENHELRLDDPSDLAFMERVKEDAISYLRRNFALAIPKPVEQASILELLTMAAGKGHRQLCACTILKTVHIINHMAGRELLFRLPVSDRDLFHLVEEKVYRVVGAMLSGGFPITEFIGGRKNLDSTYTKLLSKRESTAAALYDKLRFRIVTRTKDDILPILLYLTEHLFPFNYIVPRESTNTLFPFREYCSQDPHLMRLLERSQGEPDKNTLAVDNQFSAPTYRVIHFVTDVPVRVPSHIMESAPPGSETLGPIVYMLCEFQMLDAETDAANEIGEASHDAYKRRQREAVFRRLRLGARSKLSS